MLPAMSWNVEISPETCGYRDDEYKVSYVYCGATYPKGLIRFRLGELSLCCRFIALVTFASARRREYHFKIWTPAACRVAAAKVARICDAD